MDKSATLDLLLRLTSKNSVIRSASLESLLKCDDTRIRRLAARASLGDPTADNRMMAVDDLVFTGERRDVGLLLSLSHDPSPFVRASVADALTKNPTKLSKRRLIEMMKDPHFLVRSWSAAAVSLVLSDAVALKILQDRLAAETDDYVRVAILSGLFEHGEREALVTIQRLTGHDDKLVADRARDAYTRCTSGKTRHETSE